MPLPLRVWLFLQAFFIPLSYAAPSAIPGSVSQDSGTTISQTQIGDTLAWYDDLENALGVAKEEYRPVIVFFSSPSDGWSNRLRVEVFADEAVKRELEHYVRVEIAVEDEPETARRYLVQGLPSIRILSAEGRVLQKFDGFVRAPQMLRMLRASLNAEFLRKSDPEFQKMLTSLEENAVENKAWPEIMVHLGEPQKRESLRRLILELDPFPRGRLVELLSDPRLAVRLGSLELLEEIAGNDFDFDPWESPQDAAKNREALQRWASWSESTDGEAIVQVFSVLSPEQIKSYIRDMISEDASRSQRARSMLRNGGENVAFALRSFLDNSTELPADARNRVRELYYALTVPSIRGSDPDSVAKRLVFGNLDSRLDAISALKEMGQSAVPVLVDFLNDPDPLIRETAIDAVLTAGSFLALPTVEQHLKQEKEKAVVLSAIRSLGINEIRRGSDLVASYADDEDEDIAIMALESLGGLRADSQSKVIADQLQDDRWRVRIAALETIGRMKATGFAPKIKTLLKDEDEFVMAAAVQTLAKIDDKSCGEELLEVYQKEENLRGPVINALLSLELPLPSTLQEDLEKSGLDSILAVIDAVANEGASQVNLIAPFITHEDLDVACAAIRVVSRVGMSSLTNLQAIGKVLEEGQPEKVSAALESLYFEEFQYRRYELTRGKTNQTDSVPEDIQQIYDVFLERKPTRSGKQDAEPLFTLFRNAETFLAPDNLPEHRYHASLILARTGLPEAIEMLEAGLKSNSISQRKDIAYALESASEGAIPLLVTLMRDPAEEVRATAADAMLEHENSRAYIESFFDEMTRLATRLRPQEVNIYSLRSAIEDSPAKEIANRYAKEILETSNDTALRSFAALALRYAWKYGDEETLMALTSDKEPELRRVAWFSIGRNNLKALRPHLSTIVNDPSEKVRGILPYLIGKDNGYLIHYYGGQDSQRFSDYIYDSFGNDTRRLDEDSLAALKALSEDSSPIVRIDSSFVLMAKGEQPAAEYLESTLSSFPDRDSIERKVSDYLEENYMWLPEGYGFLANYIDTSRISDSTLEEIYSHFRITPDGEREQRDLAWAPREELPDAGPEVPGASAADAIPTPKDSSLELVYFYNPGCKECDRVQDHLDEMRNAFPRLEITSHNLRNSESAKLNEALSERFGVPERIRMVAPAVFTGDGYLIKDDIFPTRLGNLIVRSSSTGNSNSGWAALEISELTSAASAIENRFSSVGFIVILSAGLLDGINPCAFATIILFLSYLQIAKHTPRQILAVGLSFISAVFLTYFALGLGLVEVVTRLQFLKGVGVALNLGLAVFALVIMFYSVRDGILCLQGRLAETTLQLPSFLKDRIRKVARTGARHHRYVIAAFVSGFIISVLELACTGQVYLPTINYMVQEGRNSAYIYLLIYNLAFVMPLIAIFILAFFGLKSDALINFQKNHSAAIKFATAGLFLALFILLLYQVLR